MSWAARKWAEQQPALWGEARKARVLLHQLADFANSKDGTGYPDQNRLADRTGWAKSTLKRWTDFLRKIGLISTQKRWNKAKGYCDAMVYTLHLDVIASPDDVQKALEEMRSRTAKANGKNADLPTADGNRQNRDFPRRKANRHSEGGKSSLVANNLYEPHEESSPSPDLNPRDLTPLGGPRARSARGRARRTMPCADFEPAKAVRVRAQHAPKGKLIPDGFQPAPDVIAQAKRQGLLPQVKALLDNALAYGIELNDPDQWLRSQLHAIHAGRKDPLPTGMVEDLDDAH